MSETEQKLQLSILSHEAILFVMQSRKTKTLTFEKLE